MTLLRNNFMQICALIDDSVDEGHVRIGIANKVITELTYDYLKSGMDEDVDEAVAGSRSALVKQAIRKGTDNWEAFKSVIRAGDKDQA